MTLEETDVTVEQLQEVRDRPFTEAYKTHDVGQEVLTARLEARGYRIEQHGTDERYVDGVYYGEGPDIAVRKLRDRVERNEDGVGSTYIDSKTKQFIPEEHAYETIAYVEVKTKESQEWFGRLNLRHLREYVNFSKEVDVPVFLWFALVDRDDAIPMVHREGFLEVEGMEQIEGDVVDVSDETVVFYEEDVEEIDDGLFTVDGSDVVEVRPRDIVVDSIPNVHGNHVVELNDDEFRSFPHFLYEIENNK